MVGRLLERHVETGGGLGGGGDGRGFILFSEVRVGERDDLLHCQGFSSALYHWLCSSVHL